MSYTINKFDGTLLVTLQEGAISQNLNISLIGKNYPGYGTVYNENIVYLTENFSGVSAPSKPIRGQLWYDTTTNRIQVMNSNSYWRPVGSADVTGIEPTQSGTGEFWFNDTNNQLYVYDGSQYQVSGIETGAIVQFYLPAVPTGWLLCDGSNVSRSTYQVLWNKMGSPNTGDGITTFTLPTITNSNTLTCIRT